MSLAARAAIATVPGSYATLALSTLGAVVAISLLDASPCRLALVGPEGRRNPLVAALAP